MNILCAKIIFDFNDTMNLCNINAILIVKENTAKWENRMQENASQYSQQKSAELR